MRLNGNAARPVVIFTSGNYMEAYFVASMLNGFEVTAIVLDDYICRIYPQSSVIVGGVKVVVKQEEVEAALQLLEDPHFKQLFCGECLPVPLSLPAVLLQPLRSARKLRNREHAAADSASAS